LIVETPLVKLERVNHVHIPDSPTKWRLRKSPGFRARARNQVVRIEDIILLPTLPAMDLLDIHREKQDLTPPLDATCPE
jgi:hypothetical protein